MDGAKTSALFDSLGKSTGAYIALQRDNWVRANKASSDEIAIPFGVVAPPIEGAFRFGNDTSAPHRPTKGKVSLIMFVDDFQMKTKSFSPQAWCTPACFDALATTKRLAHRFPELEVTLVAHTRGFFREVAPPAPAEEANWLQRYLLGYHNVPASLVIEQTDFWRMDAPDLRRIDNKTSTFVNYSRLGGALGVTPFMMFLVDESGTIVDVSWSVGMFGGITPARLDRSKEARVAALIEILLNRQKAVSTATPPYPTTP